MRILFPILLTLATTCFAQDTKPKDEPAKFYRLDFVVKEVDGAKVLNSRAYRMQVKTGHAGNYSIRTGSKVPVKQSEMSYSMIDIGTLIDCGNIQDQPDGLSLYLAADLKSVQGEEETSAHSIIRSNTWRSDVLVKLRKPTVLFSSDDASSKHQMQLELTATPIP